MKIRILCIFFLLAGFIYGGVLPISGKIRHANTYNVIPNVNILLQNSILGTTSDSDGRFSLEIPAAKSGMFLIFEHVAFDTLIIALEDCLERSDFFLSPRIIPLAEISVEARRESPDIIKDLPQALSVISAEQYNMQGYIDAGDLLKTEQSVQIDEQLSGEKNISIRGGNAEDVIILYNGVKLNDSYDNRFDLSLINLDDLKQVEIIKGSNTALYGSEAFSGVVNFVPRTHRNFNLRFFQKFGSYNAGDWNLQLNHNFDNRLNLSYSYKEGASQRLYKQTMVPGEALENKMKYHNGSAVYLLGYEDGVEQVMSAMFLQSDVDFKNTREEEQISNLNRLVSVNYSGSIFGSDNFKIAASHQWLEKSEFLSATDSVRDIVTTIDGDFKNRKTFFNLEKTFTFKRIDLLIAYQLENGRLDFSDIRTTGTGTPVGIESGRFSTRRDGVIAIAKLHSSTGADVLQVADIDLSYRHDWVLYEPEQLIRRDPENADQNPKASNWNESTLKFSAHLSGNYGDSEFTTFVNYGTNVKFPTVFQQLSTPQRINPFSPGIDPGLEPEKNRSLEIGIDYLKETPQSQVLDGWQLAGSYFKNFYVNKFRTYYQPGAPVAFYDNVHNASIGGVEFKSAVFFFRKKVTLEFALSEYTISEQAAFPFKSDSKQVFNFFLDYAGYAFQFRWFHEGPQVGILVNQIVQANRLPQDADTQFGLTLPEHTNMDLHLGKTVEIFDEKLFFNVSVRNLLTDTTELEGIAIRDRRYYVSFGFEY